MKDIFRYVFVSIAMAIIFFTFPVRAEEIQEETEVISVGELKDISIIFAEGDSYSFTGEAIIPDVSEIRYTDENNIVQEKEDGFEIVYDDSSNVDVGEVDAVIKIDGYEGEATLEDVFTITLDAVQNFEISSYTCNKIGLIWDDVDGADGYAIYRSTDKSSEGKLLKRIEGGSVNKYSDNSVKVGKTYYYTIKAYRIRNGEDVYSSVSRQIKQKAKLRTPAEVIAKRTSYNTIQVTWTKVANASGYRIYRSTSEDGEYSRVATVINGGTLLYKDVVPTCGQRYYYKVAAYRTYNKSKYFGNRSAAASARTTPARIHFNDKTVPGMESVTLCWNRSAGAEGYMIYRSTERDSGYTLVKTITSGTKLKWINTNRDKDTVYYYKIRPYTVVNDKKVYGSYSYVYKKVSVAQLIEKIQDYTYVDYLLGGNTTEGWDCSGFTQWAMKYIYGVSIPKSSAEQAKFGKSVDKNDMSKWLPGDILVYASRGRVNHVALYIGNGKIMHALNSKYGTVIQDVEYYEAWDSKNSLCAVRRCF